MKILNRLDNYFFSSLKVCPSLLTTSLYCTYSQNGTELKALSAMRTEQTGTKNTRKPTKHNEKFTRNHERH